VSGPQRPRFLSASGFDAVAVSIGGMGPTVAMNLNPSNRQARKRLTDIPQSEDSDFIP